MSGSDRAGSDRAAGQRPLALPDLGTRTGAPTCGRPRGGWYISARPRCDVWARWYGPIVERFRTWASNEPALRAALIVGSQARNTEPADEWSDLDVVIFHDHPEQLIGATDWIGEFGEVVLTMVEPTAVLASRERRVLYSDGKEVDFAVFPSEAMTFVAHSPQGLTVLERGYEVLLDKDGQLTLPLTVPRSGGRDRQGLPSEEEFQSVVADFWYHVQWAAKKLRRGELWTAKMGCDGYLKRLLVRMIEWQTTVRHGNEVDVWHDGRFLDRWAEPGVRARLPDTFARYDPRDVARGLDQTGRLFSDLAREVASRGPWVYPERAESVVRTLVTDTLRAVGGTP